MPRCTTCGVKPRKRKKGDVVKRCRCGRVVRGRFHPDTTGTPRAFVEVAERVRGVIREATGRWPGFPIGEWNEVACDLYDGDA